ncbi:MAG: hypothetical protein AAF211_06925 [Myxococcota bacterium]
MKKYIPTGTAARQLGVSRCFLDEIAPLVAKARPDLVFRVGKGTRSRHYRWAEEHLAEAINSVERPPPTRGPAPYQKRERIRLASLVPGRRS